MLGFDPISGGFRHDEDEPLELSWLVVDEVSMLDLPLAHSLLRALPDDARVLLVGDADQLEHHLTVGQRSTAPRVRQLHDSTDALRHLQPETQVHLPQRAHDRSRTDQRPRSRDLPPDADGGGHHLQPLLDLLHSQRELAFILHP